MKANRKFKEDGEAVSAVIGVILMVAITVAIAATVYVYVSGMLGGGSESAPSMSFTKENSPDGIRVISAGGNYSWSDFTVNGNSSISYTYVEAGQFIGCDGDEMTIVHDDTNTLVGGPWTWN